MAKQIKKQFKFKEKKIKKTTTKSQESRILKLTLFTTGFYCLFLFILLLFFTASCGVPIPQGSTAVVKEFKGGGGNSGSGGSGSSDVNNGNGGDGGSSDGNGSGSGGGSEGGDFSDYRDVILNLFNPNPVLALDQLFSLILDEYGADNLKSKCLKKKLKKIYKKCFKAQMRYFDEYGTLAGFSCGFSEDEFYRKVVKKCL